MKRYSIFLIYTLAFSVQSYEINYARVLEDINKKTSFNPCVTENPFNLTNCDNRNFWQEICAETQLEQRHNDYYAETARKYQNELQNFIQANQHRLTEYKNFKMQVESSKNPLLKLNLDETLTNYNTLFETKSKDEVYTHIKNELIPSLFLDPKHYLIMNLYHELDNKLNTKTELQVFNYARDDKSGPYLNFIKVAYEELPYADFIAIVKKLISLNYNISWGKIEDQVEQNLQFTKIVNQKFINKNKKTKVKNLYFIAVQNVPANLKKYLPKSSPLSVDEKNSKDPNVNFKSTIIEKNAHYDPKSQKIVIYGGYGEEGDDATLIRAIGHELGHLIAKNMKSQDQVLNSCFEGSGSVEALNDELGETFADWVSVEILARYIKNSKLTGREQQVFIKNSLFTCAPTKLYQKTRSDTLSGQDPHPRWDKRINRIIFAHPLVKKLWSCKEESGATYCQGVAQ